MEEVSKHSCPLRPLTIEEKVKELEMINKVKAIEKKIKSYVNKEEDTDDCPSDRGIYRLLIPINRLLYQYEDLTRLCADLLTTLSLPSNKGLFEGEKWEKLLEKYKSEFKEINERHLYRGE